MVCALWLNWDAALTMRLVPTGHFLFFASPKKRKQRKATPTCRPAAQTSLTAHPFFGACELAALCASSDKRTLVPEKACSVRLHDGEGEATLNGCGELGSLKTDFRLPFCIGRIALDGFSFAEAHKPVFRLPDWMNSAAVWRTSLSKASKSARVCVFRLPERLCCARLCSTTRAMSVNRICPRKRRQRRFRWRR